MSAFKESNHAPESGAVALSKRRSPRRAAHFLAAMLMLASASLLGAPPAQASDGHSTGMGNANVKYVKAGKCHIYSGSAVDVKHRGSREWHFMGGGLVICTDGRHTIELTVVQERDSNGTGNRGGVARADSPGFAGARVNRSEYLFAHTSGACKGGNERAAFRTWVKPTIDGVTYQWIINDWQPVPGQGCL